MGCGDRHRPERQPDHDAFPSELAASATSLQIEGGGAPIDRSEVARDLIRRLDHWYDASRSRGIEILNLPGKPGASTWAGSSGSQPRRRLSGRLVDIDLRLGLTLAVASQADRNCRRESRSI